MSAPYFFALRSLILACFASLVSNFVFGQTGARFEDAKRSGMSYITSGHFDKAAGRLEEVWEEDKSDLMVGEFLAVAYLNTEDRASLPLLAKRGFKLIEYVVAQGGKATFLVHHSHENLAWLQGREMHRYCSGRLTVSARGMTFISERGEKPGEHSFTVIPGGLGKISFDGKDRRGTFHIQTDDHRYSMVTRNWNPDESRFLVELVKEQFRLKN